MAWWEQLGEGARKALVAAGTSLLVIVGLLNGACSSAPSTSHCWQPGRCYERDPYDSCAPNESSESGPCATTLRVGACVSPSGRRTYLYAPLHGLIAPNCQNISGPGAVFERE